MSSSGSTMNIASILALIQNVYNKAGSWLFSNVKVAMFLLFCVYLLLRRRRIIKNRIKDNRPPGPTGMPLWGSLPFIWQFHNTKNHLKYMRKLGATYPGVCTLPIGQNEVILVNDLNLLKEMLAMKEISNRSPIFIDMVGEGKTHATMNGECWLKNKKITQSIINTFATRHIDEMLDKALKTVVFPKIEQENIVNQQPFYSRKLLRYTFFWVFFRLIYGQDSKHDALDQKTYDENLDKHLKFRIVPYTLFSHILGKYYYVFKYIGSTFYKYHHAYLNVLQKHWDLYMNDKQENKESTQCIIRELMDSDMDRSQIFNEMSNVIGGSIDNTSNVLGFMLFNLGKNNPRDIQDTLYQELQSVHRAANATEFDYNLLKHCHKLRAFIYECMRLHMPNPLGATRYCVEDVNVKYKNKRYFIPKGSVIWWNVANTVYDKDYWDGDKYPNGEIVLERFLENGDSNGKFQQRQELMIFGWGKRKCTGRLIVIREMIHIVGHLVWRYKFRLSEKDAKRFQHIDDVKKGIGFTECKPFGLLVEKRR